MNTYDTLFFSDVLTFTENINQCESLSSIQDVVLSKISEFGFEHIFAGIIPYTKIPSAEQVENVIFGNLPHEWVERYFHNGYLDIDPTIQHIRQHSTMLVWKTISQNQSHVMAEASEFGLDDGITVPMLSMDGIKLGMSFVGKNISQSPECKITCQFISALATARAMEILPKSTSEPYFTANFTPTEFTCLRWVAEGKTNWEISKLFSISEKTVEKHLHNCLLKTNTLNRTQLVATCLRQGLIK